MKFKDKNTFRQKCKQNIEKATKINKIKKDILVCKKIEELINKTKAKNILFYLPMKQEVNVYKLLQKLRKQSNRDIFVPFMEGVSFKMVKFRLPLSRRRFGIFEPNNSFAKSKKIDLAIVPVLGVDGAFRRIGFGKGMYDRFFESLPYKPNIAFVELVECFTSSLVGEAHDIQADIYITPYITIKRGKR